MSPLVANSSPANDAGLRVSALTVTYETPRGRFVALRDTSLEIARGTVLALVGESGSGKTTLAMAIPRLLPAAASVRGTIAVGGRSVLPMGDEELRELRRTQVSIVLQDPVGSLVPGIRVGQQLARATRHRMRLPTWKEAEEHSRHMMRSVGLSDVDRVWTAYPGELSGGMCQRIMIALALATTPTLVIADEPLSALDAASQVGVLELLLELQNQQRFAMLYVTHDLRVAARFQSIGVLRSGALLEVGASRDVLTRPRNEYTRRLVEAARTLSLPSLSPHSAEIADP